MALCARYRWPRVMTQKPTEPSNTAAKTTGTATLPAHGNMTGCLAQNVESTSSQVASTHPHPSTGSTVPLQPTKHTAQTHSNAWIRHGLYPFRGDASLTTPSCLQPRADACLCVRAEKSTRRKLKILAVDPDVPHRPRFKKYLSPCREACHGIQGSSAGDRAGGWPWSYSFK
jgi:hypothetical protein